MSRLIPVVCAVLAVLLCAATGWTQRSLLGTVFEDRFYGFFLRAYPLFLFAVAYGAARIVTAAAAARNAGAPGRLVIAGLALMLFLLACLYPTFGGLVLRSGYAVGSLGILRGLSPGVAQALGAGASALSFGVVLSLCSALAQARIRASRRAAARAMASLLALWIGALILQAPDWIGFDLLAGFPARPLGWFQAFVVASLVAAAALPHALVAPSPSR